MMHHPYVLEKLVHERRNELLREANAHRLVRHAEGERSVQASLLKHMVAGLRGLLVGLVRKLIDQGPVFTDEAFTDGYR